MTTTTENKAVVRRFIEEIVNDGNYEVADELIAPEYVRHDPSTPDEQRGPEGFIEMIQGLAEAFPDNEVGIEEMVAEGDLVVFRATERGTHEGVFMGVEPTGRSYEMTGMAMHRVEDGKLTETWATWDMLGTMEQLGVLDPLAA